MGILTSTGACPYCDSGHSTACFAEYDDGYKCFSCGIVKFYNSEQQAWRGIVNKQINKERITLDYETNPKNFNIIVKQWLYEHYVYDNTIRRFNIFSCADSLIFPSVVSGKIEFWQQRFFPEKKIIGYGRKISAKLINNTSNKVFLVEDYISAVRLAELNYNVWCIFGTSLSKDETIQLLKEYNNICLWLDGDKAGMDGANKLIKWFGVESRKLQKSFPMQFTNPWIYTIIQTELDPKKYTQTEIKEIIDEKFNN